MLSDPTWADEALPSAEIRALLACARAVLDPGRLPELQAALTGCTSTDRLCEAAIEHGMLGHLHSVVAAAGGALADPAPVARLAELQRLAAQRSLRQTARLLRLLGQLSAAGVQAMPYKGPAWAERFYGDVTLRSWADLDVLVPYERLQHARGVLLADGFVDGSPFNARLSGRRHRGWGEVAFSAIDQGIHVELHWEVTVGFSARSLRPESLFARAGHLSLLGQEVPTPSGTDCLLMTCLNGARDRWNDIEEMLGLAVQIRSTPETSWHETLDTARRAGCLRRTTISVAHVCRVLDLSVPQAVAGAIAHDAVARALFRSLKPEGLGPAPSTSHRRQLRTIFWRSATEDSVVAGLGQGAVRLFRPSPEDWAWIALPRHAEWLYYVFRPARLAVKWAKRL
ncbi:MAG: hypothetical protein A2133_10820 [Actinobacteria bacterium RBG_16_64_13]|nr:MAG: hypothetical protein A2133_10820 [Actinobacteria bacterium RBG_16_64_13]